MPRCHDAQGIPLIKPDDFACSCGNDGWYACYQVREWAYRFFTRTSGKQAYHCGPGELMSQAVMWLNWECGADVTGILADQWFGVFTKTSWGEFTTAIQCDSVEDGIAFTVKAYVDAGIPEKYEEYRREGRGR